MFQSKQKIITIYIYISPLSYIPLRLGAGVTNSKVKPSALSQARSWLGDGSFGEVEVNPHEMVPLVTSFRLFWKPCPCDCPGDPRC